MSYKENKTVDTTSSENNNVYKTPPIKIGTGLHRSKLVSGGSAIKTSTRVSSALTIPSRVNISSSGLTPVGRTNSERYQSAYSRLGANRNTSSPSLNNQDALVDDTKGGRSIQIVTDTYRKYSAKRASFPAVLSPNLGVTPAQELKGYSSTEKLPGSAQQEGSTSLQKGLLDRSDNYGTENNTANKNDNELAINSLLREQEKLSNDTKIQNDNVSPAKMSSPVDKDVNQESSHPTANNTEENDKIKAHSNIQNTDSDSKLVSHTSTIQSDQDCFTLQNYVIPPRRRHGNKSREIHASPIESNVVDKSIENETIHTGKEPERGISGTVHSTSVSSVAKTENNNPIDYVDDTDSVPKPMQRTRRRLTKRKISFKKLEDDEYIGFASLPEQVHRKAVRRGFEFTLMVVGETGLGKSTLINSLFLTDLYKDRKVGKIEERVQKTVELEKKELEIEERGVKLKLTIVDTPGFNDAVNAEESWKPIVSYIDKQFESYFKAESGLNRKNIHDTRVHCCLYFISPYGHGLRPVDISVMKKLHHKVNIVPLVAKADMLTKKEIKNLKEKVLSEIQKHKIQIYQFPDCDSDEDEEFKQQDQELKKAIPFAVVGSNTVVEAGGKKIRGRMYPWGIVEVENPSHCDFVKLRQMLISTHMQDLKDVTCDVHYENYRAEHISEQITGQQKERGKLKRDSVTNMDKMMDTEKLLQEKEAEIKRMQEMLAKMQSQLNQNSPKLNGKVAAV